MFIEALEKEMNTKKSITENGAVAYKSSGSKMLDFNFKLSSFRNETEAKIEKDFVSMYFENPLMAIKYMFYVGDIREGLGERKVFKVCFKWLGENKPEIAKKLLKLIPEYTRWDNLIYLHDIKSLKNEIEDIINRQLREDILGFKRNFPISLLAKWMPSENASSIKAKHKARELAKKLNLSNRQYREVLSILREHLDVTERKMSANKWNQIHYENVPSKANLNYKDAFLRNDKERREKYLDNLKNNHKKINAGTLYPYEIINRYLSYEYDETLEQLWKSLPNKIIQDSLVVRDGSGSMYQPVAKGTDAATVATALTIYISEKLNGEWKNRFITFSKNPKLVDMTHCETLKDKINLCAQTTENSNTDVYKTMKLILDTAIKNNVSQSDMPKNIIIISDMQFDDAVNPSLWNNADRTYRPWDSTLFEDISNLYKLNGYELPKICFWNVCGYDAGTIPMQDNERGLVLCSGFSINTLNMVMSGIFDPYEVLMKELNKERYDDVENALKV